MDILLFLAVLPVALLGLFIYKKDKNKEPMGLLAKIFFLGFFSAIPVVIVELFLGAFFPTDGVTDFLSIFINVFISVALVEEGFKWFVTKLVGYDNKEFDEIYDIIVYAVFASLGFACIENILYVFSSGVSTAIMRAIFSIPGHTCFAVVMGYFFTKAKIASINNHHGLYVRNLILSIICPTVVHTIYDALLFYSSDMSFIIFIIFDVIMVITCFIIVGRTSKVQQVLSTNISSGVIVNDGRGHVQINTSNPGVLNFCPVCGRPSNGSNFCGGCGMRLIK